ncbi:KipI family sensor histidine kinase inhibitor [Amycolatopsis sulphurea]|uniref:KipI family sensor histidine kinase inhibitor n=1 Tax=Amycolatopsis sulphurea TaxID=76022 RepID=A0A2A9FKP8_9PSEU|nr:carboxyltransferase domain-containing protein [Amycolatopsis sulphurea]PFG51029.1 KipI family sensor histidine kinase inhibitor [Amycolatopsis sulphurea]
MTGVRTAAKLDVSPCGDAAVRITVDGAGTEEVWGTVHHLARRLNDGEVPGVLSAVPTYDAVLVEFDPCVTTADTVMFQLLSWEAPDALAPLPSRVLDVPVLFGGEAGPDLMWVAEVVGLPATRVVELMCETELLIRCLGGPAASAMTDGPDFGEPVPRLATPRLRVPPGAVSLAGRQAVLGPVAAPSGWRQIGRTPLTVLQTDTEAVVPYRPGDRLRYYAIDEATYARLRGQPMRYRADD